MNFRKSSRCSKAGCVWIADLPGAIAVSSTSSGDDRLTFPRASWHAFLDDVKAGKFDD